MSVSFALASAHGPVSHTHEHSDPHGHGGPLHSHLKLSDSAEKTNGVGIHAQDPDDDAQMLDSFTVLKNSTAKLLIALVITSVPSGMRTDSGLVRSVTPRAHDPPDLGSSPARAPPA